MVYGNIRLKDCGARDDPRLAECVEYANSHDLLALAPGSYPLREGLTLNINLYTTSPAETRGWEAHKRHIDLQLVLSGQERIDFAFLGGMQPTGYTEENDFMTLAGSPGASVTLGPGDYAACFPEDAHMPGIAPQAPAEVKKAVFKIRV